MPLPLQVNKQNTQARVRAITFLLFCVFVVCITFLLFANKLIRCGCCCCCCWRWCVSLFWHIAVKFAQSNLWLLFTVTVTVACVFNSSDGSQFHTSLWYALLDFAWVNGSFFFRSYTYGCASIYNCCVFHKFEECVASISIFLCTVFSCAAKRHFSVCFSDFFHECWITIYSFRYCLELLNQISPV